MKYPWCKKSKAAVPEDELGDMKIQNDLEEDLMVSVDKESASADGAVAKDKIQVFSRRSAQSAHTSMQAILRKKVYMNEGRIAYVQGLWQKIQSCEPGKAGHSQQSAIDADLCHILGADAPAEEAHMCRVCLLNFTQEQVKAIKSSLEPANFVVRDEVIGERDWVRLMATTKPAFKMPFDEVADPFYGTNKGVIDRVKIKSKKDDGTRRPPEIFAVRITAGELTKFDECTIAVHWINSRVVLPFVDIQGNDRATNQAAMLSKVNDFMGRTWPVFEDVEEVCKYCKADLPAILAMKRTLSTEVHSQCKKWGEVNYVWHGLKRAPVAFVPFGVGAINFVGMSRLVGQVLTVTGMLKDSQAKKAAIGMAAQQYAKVFVLDEISDVYQFIVSSSIVASLSMAVAAGSTWTSAISALSVADLALLGSVAVVTGIVAGIGAALTRPQMVQAMCTLIASLQVLWIMFPAVRRSDSTQPMQVDPQMLEAAEKLEMITFQGGDAATEIDAATEMVDIDDDVMQAAMEIMPDDVPIMTDAVASDGTAARPSGDGDRGLVNGDGAAHSGCPRLGRRAKLKAWFKKLGGGTKRADGCEAASQ